MNREINTQWAIVIIVLLLAVLGFGAWRLWSGPSGLRSPKEAGLGRPMKPGEIPGKSPGVAAPLGGPK